MKRIKNKMLLLLFLLGTTGQVYAMGSKRPTPESSQLPGVITPILSSVNPNLEALAPVLSLVSQWRARSAPASISRIIEGSAYLDQLEGFALDSACSEYSFKNQGKAPLAFLKGFTQSYAQSLCRIKTKSRFFSFMSTFSSGNALKEALTNLQSRFSGFGPIISKELMAVPACQQLLTDVEELINNDQYACQDIVK